ncbi:helix-turn-helix domain-containing protein [Selenomonadales bacterium OttesenSCG-928-I06]|nr:helix-turn-helix domain-containing protein [Selenomonadales bacterium OttesenSCG-928-I06]
MNMDIHERIKQRRIDLDLSADDVALKLGVSRATVYRYESAEIKNMGIDKIAPLAEALNTTPSYLMGWTDDPTNYDDPDLIASLRTDILEHFNGNVEKAYKAQRAIEEDNIKRKNMAEAGLACDSLPLEFEILGFDANKKPLPLFFRMAEELTEEDLKEIEALMKFKIERHRKKAED